MNPREFCQEPGYEKALLFTYEFDALFFERIVLRDLLVGGATDIQIVGDLGRMLVAQERWVGQLRELGKSYRLSRATLPGSFHPKILVRASSKGALIWVGSGNITSGGWQTNLEVGTAWKVGPDVSDRGLWLKDMLRDLGQWMPSPLPGSTLERISAFPWLNAGGNEEPDPSLIISHRDSSLSSKLTSRWEGRQFDQVIMATGSTDESGAMISWLQKQFGISKATILLDPAMASFNQDQLNSLQVDIKLLRPADGRRVHAKCYWFTGTSGSAAVIGSANCSSAAWLLEPRHGGNIESIIVYDNPVEAEFDVFLRRFSPELTVSAVLELIEKPDEPGDVQGLEWPVAEVFWEHARSELTVAFASDPPPDAIVTVSLGGIKTICRYSLSDGVWFATLDPAHIRSKRTLFGTISVIDGGLEQVDQPFWINDLEGLRSFEEGHKFTDPFARLRHPGNSSDQQKIVKALLGLANLILTDQSGVARSRVGKPRSGGHHNGDTKEPEILPVNPQVLIRSLNEVMNQAKAGRSVFSLVGISLTGIMRNFFEFSDAQADLTALPDAGGEPDEKTLPARPPVKPPPTPPPSKNARDNLKKQLDPFVDSLRDECFAEKCTVEQLMQAAAYPLGVVVYGVAGGWMDMLAGQRLTSTIFDVVFCKSYAKRCKGLLARVQLLYQERGEKELFQQTAGDGTLWTAMLAALWRTRWDDQNGGIRKGLAMRAVLTSEALLSSATVNRVAALLTGLGPLFTSQAVLDQALKADRLFAEMETYLLANWDHIHLAQKDIEPRACLHDVHYHPTAGWAFTVERPVGAAKYGVSVYRQNSAEVIDISNGFYLNLTQASEKDPFVAGWLLGIRDLATF